MLRLRKSLPFLNGLRVWLAVALLAVAAVLLYTNLASAHPSSTERKLAAPALAAVTGEDPVEFSRDAATGAQRYELLAWTSVDAQQQQDLAPVYITTLGPPADGSQQAIVMPSSVTVSEEDPWFGPFYTLNDPDRSVSIDILSNYGFIAAYSPRSEYCTFPDYVISSLALGYQSAASNGFYVRRCPGFEHLTSLYLRVTTYPDAEVYTTHDIRVINASNPTPTTSAPTVTPTVTLEANAPPTSTPTATPTVTLEANAPPTSTPTATPTVTLEANAPPTSTPTATPTATFDANAAATSTPTATPTVTLEANAAATAASSATPSVMAPSMPSLTAVAGEGAVDLSWTAISGAQRYVLMAWSSATCWERLGGDSLTDTSYSHTGLTVVTTYYYWVRAVFGSGEKSGWSERTPANVVVAASSVVPAPTPTPPSTVFGLSQPVLSAQGGGSAVQLSWTEVSGTLRYVLMVYTTANGWERLGGDNLTDTAYRHTGLSAGTNYYYWVRAVNGSDELSAWAVRTCATA